MSTQTTERIIRQTESKWLDELFEYVRDLFSPAPIPSHDQEHHLRVWHYGRDLILELGHAGKIISAGETEALMFACFFHDTGMINESGPEHGKESRKICEEYLSVSGKEVELPDRILEAVENHDDKTYPGRSALIDAGGLNILKAVTICDDLDAFGKTGIYRFAEIYLMRGIPMEDLGLKIMANLAGRFGHFMDTCSFLPSFVRIHAPRHNITEDFFRNYNLQLRLIGKKASQPDTGRVGVIREIFRQTMAGAVSIAEVCDNALRSQRDPYVKEFFGGLRNEIAKA